jgi:hypothetical protein
LKTRSLAGRHAPHRPGCRLLLQERRDALRHRNGRLAGRRRRAAVGQHGASGWAGGCGGARRAAVKAQRLPACRLHRQTLSPSKGLSLTLPGSLQRRRKLQHSSDGAPGHTGGARPLDACRSCRGGPPRGGPHPSRPVSPWISGQSIGAARMSGLAWPLNTSTPRTPAKWRTSRALRVTCGSEAHPGGRPVGGSGAARRRLRRPAGAPRRGRTGAGGAARGRCAGRGAGCGAPAPWLLPPGRWLGAPVACCRRPWLGAPGGGVAPFRPTGCPPRWRYLAGATWGGMPPACAAREGWRRSGSGGGGRGG